MQSDFVSNVSHEFKTPIGAIEGYAMLLQGKNDLPSEETEYAEKILSNTKRLSGLVSNILLLSKVEREKNVTFRGFKTNKNVAPYGTEFYSIVNQIQPHMK